MNVLVGKSVYSGVAMGRIRLWDQFNDVMQSQSAGDVQVEKSRLRRTIKIVADELDELYQVALDRVGKEDAEIFQAYRILLLDEEFIKSMELIIEKQSVSAEYAVSEAANGYVKMFENMDDDYMKSRASDIKDITNRILNALKGKRENIVDLDEPSIIVAKNLSPLQIIRLDRSKVVAIVTTEETVNSHTAILAKTMGIPALTGVDIDVAINVDGCFGIVDSISGYLYVDPDESTIEKMSRQRDEEEMRLKLLQQLKGKEDVTLDGKHIKLFANISSLEDLKSVKENDAKGIGLFRSEFIYIERDTFPTEEEQVEIYSTLAKSMEGKQVIIRTLDIGADKQCDYFEMEKENNPALGVRAIRICLTRPDIFKTQLRALFRASAFGNISIMYPMITSVWEVERIKEIEEEVRKELADQRVEFGNPSTGIMVETPAAVMEAGELARMVDFLSIGTNDLTQYTLAVDRQNPNLHDFYFSHHPAIKKMIKMVIDSAHAEGKWVGICGELAADIELTKEFIMMGADELSVSPGKILPIRNIIRHMSIN
ncbi:MAG: phosphoenolpyruvate--protein phosphotransferase [Lachnospiraceae bacterium]|nr:phosphoenolpyruvate--protein phosphotransferase [Lachnospiraceae bacterium]